ncbi:MAG: hypothetical protein ACK2TV_03790, partial [Anaerolineales bacterium]
PLPVEQDINEETSVEALPEEEFIEISSMDIDQSQEEAHHIINKDDEIEELPEWLQEMISEPMQIEEEAIEDASTESEIKESESSSIKADYEELKNEVEESEEPSETLIEITEISTNETESEEIAEMIPEEETKPIEILPGDEETIEGQSEDAVPEVVEPIKQSHPLEFAKFQLDQGNIDQALEIFVSLKDRPDYQQYLSDIKDSLQDAISGKAKDHSAAWELVGDIAVLENNLDEAYDAYLQSIQLLLTSQKDKNETD